MNFHHVQSEGLRMSLHEMSSTLALGSHTLHTPITNSVHSILEEGFGESLTFWGPKCGFTQMTSTGCCLESSQMVTIHPPPVKEALVILG